MRLNPRKRRDRLPKVLVLPGDGIGVEVTNVSLDILKIIGEKYNTDFETETALFGGSSIDETGVPVTKEVLEKAINSDAVLMGAVADRNGKISSTRKNRKAAFWRSERNWTHSPT